MRVRVVVIEDFLVQSEDGVKAMQICPVPEAVSRDRELDGGNLSGKEAVINN
jgi:hypothetical protein